ncbi:MAG: hypothetical protein IJK51_09230 [Bacteroidaceae bacterium]|nr:hypothetical protein [Bacteroidaceae bacterium]MBQ7527027.1 hypothetical protein [Bacteroidaceae bacterium]
MNLYIRYFDEEVLVYSVEEALEFLASLEDVEINDYIRLELEKFMSGSAMFPKHIKVNQRSFFIAIKTTATTMEEFKAKGANQAKPEKVGQKEALASYTKPQSGWYAAKITFKRVIVSAETQKCQYVDTPFVCKVKAESAQDCYDKVIAHLRNRQDIDPRSQYPSIKNQNFEFSFLG